MFVLRQVNGVCDDEGYGCTRREQHGKVKFGSLMGALKTGAHQLKVVNFDPNYLNNVCFFQQTAFTDVFQLTVQRE